MPPKPTWKHEGFYEKKKHQMNEFPPRQHGFNRFQRAYGGGPKTPGGGGDGVRNQFLKDPSHDSGYDSYVRTTKPPRDPKPQFLENVINRHFGPSQAHSMNTQERLHCIEQLYVDDDHNKKHERESSMGLKSFNKWKGFGRFYSGSVMRETEGTRKRPRLNWGEGLAKLQKKKTEIDGESAASATTPTSVDYSSLSGLRTLTGGDASGSESNGRNTRAPRDPRPQFWENVTKKHFDNVLTPPSHTWRMFHHGKQHYDNDHNNNNEGESSVQLNLNKRWSRSKRFYYGDTGKEKDKNTNELGEGSNEIEETRKRRRLNWGDGLAKFEKKKREVECVSATSAVASTPTSVACSSIPTSVACSSISGVDDILHVKTATGNDSKVHILSTSVLKLLECADLSSSLGRSNAMTKVLIWKTIISKVLEETQTTISSLENELKTMQSENLEALPIAPFDDGSIEKRPLPPHLHDSREDTLCKTIISCNREIVKRSSAVFDKFCPTKCHKVMCSSSLSHENAVIKEKFAEKEWFGRFKEKVLINKYRALDHLWKKDMLLRSLRKNTPTSHSNFELSLRTISNDCHRNRSSTRHRFPFPAGKMLSLVATSEMINFTSQLLSESRNEVQKSILKTPSLILDEKDKMISMFKSRNGVVEDPVAVEKERAMINPWTSDERKIYSEKFRVFGKDFRKIASFLDHKTTADCVEFYYRSHKLDCFQKDKKGKSRESEKLSATKTGLRASGRKRNLKVNVNSQKKLSETPVKKRGIACNRRTRSGRLFLWRKHEDTKISKGDDIITCRSNSNNLGIVVHERERVSTDVLVDLCDSLPIDPVEASWDEVNVVKAKSDTTKNGDWRNLNQDESQHVEDKDVSEPTKIISIVSNESIVVQDIIEVGDETMKFVPASKVVESIVNEVHGTRIEVNVVEEKLDTIKNDDQNLNHDEFQLVEDGNVLESMEIMNMVSNERVTLQEIMEMGDEAREFAPAYEIEDSPMIEVNAGEAKLDTSKTEDQRNLNHDESQPVEDRCVSESTEIISMVSNECIIMQDIIEDGNEDTKFVPASEVVDSPGNEVNIVEPKSYTNKIEDERNLNHDESQLVEDGIVSETKEASMVSSDYIIMQDIVEVGGEVIEFVPTFEMVESPVHEVNGSRDVVNVVKAKSDTQTRGDQRNLYLDESQLNEEGEVSEPMEIVSMISNKRIVTQDTMDEGDEATKFLPTSMIVESSVNEVNDDRDEVNVVKAKSGTNKKEDQRNLNHDEFQLEEDGNVSESTEIISFVSSDCTIMQNIMEEGDKVTKFVSASVIIESPVNEVNDHRDEVNVVKAMSDTNKKEDQRNLNNDEFQLEEDGNVSESTEIISFVSSDCTIMQNIMEEGDEITKFVSASVIIGSPVNDVNDHRDEVNDHRDEVNAVEANSDTNKKEDQRNLNHDEFQLEEDGNVSESTEIISFVSSDHAIMQNIMEEGDKVTKFVSASVIIESPVNEVNDYRDEVNVVVAKSDTNKKEDQRNLNHDEFQLEEDRNDLESTEIISFVSSDCTVMQNIMEEGDKVTKFVPASVTVESPVNELNDPRDEENVAEAKSDTNEKEDQRNLNHDEFQPIEDSNVLESTEIISIVSNDYIVMQNIMEEGDKVTEFVPVSEIESPLNEVNVDREEVNVVDAKSYSNENENQSNLSHDESQPMEGGNVSETTETINMISNECIILQDIMELEDEVTDLVPASETAEPCQTHSVAEEGLVSEKLAELPTCLDGKCEYDDSNLVTHGYGVVLYNSDKSSSVSDERATIMPNMMEVRGVVAEVESASRIIVSCQTHSAAEEDILVSENTLLQNTVDTSVQQDGNDKLNSMSIGGNDELHNPGISLKDPVDRQVEADISCSSSSAATELPQNIEQTYEHDKAHCPGSSDSEIAPTDAVVFKLFGKMIIVPSSVERHDLSVNENGERGERPRAEDLVHEQVERRERPKRKVSEPKYLKDYFRFK